MNTFPESPLSNSLLISVVAGKLFIEYFAMLTLFLATALNLCFLEWRKPLKKKGKDLQALRTKLKGAILIPLRRGIKWHSPETKESEFLKPILSIDLLHLGLTLLPKNLSLLTISTLAVATSPWKSTLKPVAL